MVATPRAVVATTLSVLIGWVNAPLAGTPDVRSSIGTPWQKMACGEASKKNDWPAAATVFRAGVSLMSFRGAPISASKTRVNALMSENPESRAVQYLSLDSGLAA
jgi:hypothetical protein